MLANQKSQNLQFDHEEGYEMNFETSNSQRLFSNNFA